MAELPVRCLTFPVDLLSLSLSLNSDTKHCLEKNHRRLHSNAYLINICGYLVT
jgi:lactate dehydrogenase-like 2-hydroxyacid dehydrogenase